MYKDKYFFVILHENDNKCYYLTDTKEVQSSPLATFPFGTKFAYLNAGIYIFIKIDT